MDLDDLIDVILQLIKYLKCETYAGLLHVFASCTNRFQWLKYSAAVGREI